ncbi:MAG TPA: class I SAM-dependent methyltransferase [Spirosoma sp.]|nr:class I SAM-dependent methyltransferase [Spirosoma sp.]
MAASSTHFDWIAPVYDALVFMVFGHRLKRAQAVFLDRIPPGASVLIVGGGTGWLLEPLLTNGLPARIVFLEASARMLAGASRRMLKQALPGTVEFRLGDERSLRPDEHFDVLITPFVLDLFTTETLQTRLIPRLRSALKADGLLLVTDFIQTSVWWQQALLWTMIRFFVLTAGIEARQLADWQRLLSEAGLWRRESSVQVSGFVSTDVWSMSGP